MNFVEGLGSRFGKSDCDKIKSGNAQFLCAFLWLALSPCFPFWKGMVDINTQMKNSKLLQFLLDNAETLKKELSRKITSAICSSMWQFSFVRILSFPKNSIRPMPIHRKLCPALFDQRCGKRYFVWRTEKSQGSGRRKQGRHRRACEWVDGKDAPERWRNWQDFVRLCEKKTGKVYMTVQK